MNCGHMSAAANPESPPARYSRLNSPCQAPDQEVIFPSLKGRSHTFPVPTHQDPSPVAGPHPLFSDNAWQIGLTKFRQLPDQEVPLRLVFSQMTNYSAWLPESLAQHRVFIRLFRMEQVDERHTTLICQCLSLYYCHGGGHIPTGIVMFC